MFCGHFHMEPPQILTGEVRVDIKPSEPCSRLPHLGAAARGHTWEGLHSAGMPPMAVSIQTW